MSRDFAQDLINIITRVFYLLEKCIDQVLKNAIELFVYLDIDKTNRYIQNACENSYKILLFTIDAKKSFGRCTESLEQIFVDKFYEYSLDQIRNVTAKFGTKQFRNKIFLNAQERNMHYFLETFYCWYPEYRVFQSMF